MHTRWEQGGPIPNNCFITLTYNKKHLPPGGGLDHHDFQLFMKKLRRRHPGDIRYLHCGEYGPATNRAHHHAILFGIDFHEDRKRTLLDIGDGDPDQSTIWLSDELSECWDHRGYTSLSPVNYATACYVAGYVTKKLKAGKERETAIYGASAEPIFIRKPAYNTMSRKPGLGTEWIKKYWAEVYPMDRVVIEGKQYRPPAFYDKWIAEKHPSIWERVFKNRQEHLAVRGPTHSLELKARKINDAKRVKSKTQERTQF